MEQQQGQAQPVTGPNQGVSFRSTDIMNTQAARPKEYFVKIRPSAQSRLLQMQAENRQHKTDMKEWLDYYWKVIIVVFLSVVIVAIVIAVIVVIAFQNISSTEDIGRFSEKNIQNISLRIDNANV